MPRTPVPTSRSAASAADRLGMFSPATATWFREVFAEPTAAQAGAWEAIAGGENALVVAPTGSGKTLAAFLWALDDLTRSAPPEPKNRCRVLYVSPLKALAVDVERNLRAPLTGITQTALRLGQAPPNVTVGVRSGDTTPTERRAIATRPPDILITTPGVAVPDADLGGPRRAALGAHGDRRRGARAGRDQAGRAPRGVVGAARGATAEAVDPACPTGRCSGSGCRRPYGPPSGSRPTWAGRTPFGWSRRRRRRSGTCRSSCPSRT